MQSRPLEEFYMFFQGILIFQTLIFGTLYFVTLRRDLLYYALFLFFAAVYFFINAPFTFFGISEDFIWTSVWYDDFNTPIIILENLFYLLFLKTFFADITVDKTISGIFRFTLRLICLLVFLFILLTILKLDKQFIFYSVNLIAVIPAIAIAYIVFKKKPPFGSLVGKGLLCTIIGTCVTVCMIVLGNNGVHHLFTIGYPLFFVRLGVLGDMIFYLTAILKKWHYQEQQLAIEKFQSRQEILNERFRISRELHDDIGSTLGSISIYSEVAKNRNKKNENAEEVLSKIGNSSRELIDKMNDIVWSLNPNNESAEQLQNRMTAFAAMILAPRDIVYEFRRNDEIKRIQMTTAQRKNIFLIFKESVYNIAKYAECKNVNIRLNLKSNIFSMLILDDGKGFDINVNNSYNGNGIKNMKARAAEINGKLNILSNKNTGTSVELIASI